MKENVNIENQIVIDQSDLSIDDSTIRAMNILHQIGYNNYNKLSKSMKASIDDIKVYLEVERSKLEDENENIKNEYYTEREMRKESDLMLKTTLPNSYIIFTKINLGLLICFITLYLSMMFTNMFFINPRVLVIGILGSISMCYVFRSMKKEWVRTIDERINQSNQKSNRSRNENKIW